MPSWIRWDTIMLKTFVSRFNLHSTFNHLNEIAIIDIAINDEIINTIFHNNHTRICAICIGRSKLYFPMFRMFGQIQYSVRTKIPSIVKVVYDQPLNRGLAQLDCGIYAQQDECLGWKLIRTSTNEWILSNQRMQLVHT